MAPETNAGRRAYNEIKQLILTGRLGVRARIDVDAMARSLGLSSMPVRQALSLLTWERLVRPGKRAAYEVTLWSVAELTALYEWRGVLLGLALPLTGSGAELKRVVRTRPYANAVHEAMRLLEQEANVELRRAAINTDERLHIARLVEPEILGDVHGELEVLVEAIAERGKRARSLARAYTRRRVTQAAALRERVVLAALPSNGAPS